MRGRRESGVRRARSDQHGQVLVMTAVSLFGLLAITAFAVDIGYVLRARGELQAASDSAALAGAQDLPDTSAAIATARAYSAIGGGKNASSTLGHVTMVGGYPLTKCLTSVGLTCSPANAIVVRQETTVPTFFGGVMGVTSMRITATSTAIMKGGVPEPLDVMLVVDTTASMQNRCTSSVPGVGSPTRLDCAKAGIRALLSQLWPCGQGKTSCGSVTNGNVVGAVDQVGLSTFPGLTSSASASREFDCPSNITGAMIAPYSAAPVYSIQSLSSDYRTSTTSALNGANSNLVKSVDWGHGNGCGSSSYGLEAPGGVGTYFADAITQAQSSLSSAGRPTAQNVIIIVSDGDANYTGVSAPCHAAITAAQSAAGQGTWIYSIAYGASSSSSSSCTVDRSHGQSISALATMQALASDPTKFFNQPSDGDLTNIFQKIVIDLTTTRLVSDSTP